MSPTQMALLTLFAILIAEQSGQPFETQLPVMTRDEIRAAREKFDRELKLDTKRPWDGMHLTGPRAFEKLPTPDKK